MAYYRDPWGTTTYDSPTFGSSAWSSFYDQRHPPKDMWGTSSAQYGHVSTTGQPITYQQAVKEAAGMPRPSPNPSPAPTGPQTYMHPAFGDPSNPNLSNPYKQNAYNEWVAQQQQNVQPASPSAEEVRAGISAQYSPVYEMLDKRVAGLPEAKAVAEKLITTLAGTQREQAGRGKESQLEKLATAKKTEKERGAMTMREMAQDARNLLRAAANVFGGSSATEAVTSGIGKKVAQLGAQTKMQLNEALTTIGTKISDVEREYQNQLGAIENWVATKTSDIADEFRARREEIEAQKAAAKGEEANALANLELQIFTNAQQRLAEVDRMARQFAYNLKSWQATRTGELQDYLAKLQMHAAYEGKPFSYQMPGMGGGTRTGGAPGYSTVYGGYAPTAPTPEEEEPSLATFG